MAKIAKIALAVVAVVALVTPGAPFAIGAAIGTLGVSAGVAAFVAQALLYGALAIGASAILSKKPNLGQTGITSKISLDANASQWIVAGTFACPTQLIYFASAGTDNKNLSMIFVHSCFPITRFRTLAVNNIGTAFPTPSGAYSGVLSIQTATGNQTSNPFTGTQGAWGSADKGQGLAMSCWNWTYDKDKLASGLPQNLQFVVDGQPVYDPRRDSTRGGSGSMRADDQTTWAFTISSVDIGRNPALFELSYRLGWRKNGRLAAGQGEDPLNLDMASYIASANICDEVVNGKPRYRFDGIIPIGPSIAHNDNLAKIHASCGGRPTDAGGLIGLWVAHDDTGTSVMTLTDDDFVGPIGWQPLPEGQIRNTARGSYVEPLDFYQGKPYPEVAPSDLRTLDNGQELDDDLDFGGIIDVDQARRLASIRLRESRQGQLEAPISMRALGLKPMSVVSITRSRFSWSNRKFRLETMGIGINKVNVSLRAIQSSDYADIANTSVSTPANLPTLGFIPVLGTLALQNDVDFATQVTGSTKPANNADVTNAVLAAGGIAGTTAVAGTGHTLAEVTTAAFTGGSGGGYPPVAVIVGTSNVITVTGSGVLDAQYTGIATGSGTVTATLNLQVRAAGGSFSTLSGGTDVQSGTVGDSFSALLNAVAWAVPGGGLGELRAVLTISSGDGLNISQPDSFMVAT